MHIEKSRDAPFSIISCWICINFRFVSIKPMIKPISYIWGDCIRRTELTLYTKNAESHHFLVCRLPSLGSNYCNSDLFDCNTYCIPEKKRPIWVFRSLSDTRKSTTTRRSDTNYFALRIQQHDPVCKCMSMQYPSNSYYQRAIMGVCLQRKHDKR